MNTDITKPIIVLVRTQLPQNIGSTARAMKNCGLSELRLVEPREKWPNDDASSMAAGADDILKNIKVFENIPSALSDVIHIFSLTARNRDITKIELGPDYAAKKIYENSIKNEKSAILFGPEQSGLTNDEIAYSNFFVKVPMVENFSSLNLSQAVLLMAWEWRKLILKNYLSKAEYKKISEPRLSHKTPPSTVQERDYFFSRLEKFLELNNFFATMEMKPSVMNNLKSMFVRFNLSQQEVGTLNGIISAIEKKISYTKKD